ncbi:MAG: malate:quinone oxidoreductase, partial [Aquiluna sp.]
PTAKPEDWTYYEAGQRAQIIKPTRRGGSLQFGTEVISAADGSIAGLLGASPGASVSVDVMLDVYRKLFGHIPASIGQICPSKDVGLNAFPSKARATLRSTAGVLKLKA